MSQFCGSPAAPIRRCGVTAAAAAGNTTAATAIEENAARRPRFDMASLPTLCNSSGFPRTGHPPLRSLPHLIEVSQIRRRLVLAGRHQQAIRAHEIVFLADGELLVVLAAIIFGPVRTRVLVPH